MERENNGKVRNIRYYGQGTVLNTKSNTVEYKNKSEVYTDLEHDLSWKRGGAFPKKEIGLTLVQIEDLMAKLPVAAVWIQCKGITDQYKVIVKKNLDVVVRILTKPDTATALSNLEEMVFEIKTVDRLPQWKCISHKIVII